MSKMSNNRNKTHELTIDINAKNREVLDNDTTFFSMDAGTGEKIINFTRDDMAYDLTGAEVHVAFHFVDERATQILDSEDAGVKILDAQAGRCSVEIPSHVYAYEGDVLLHVYIILESGEKSIDCGVIPTRFENSWLGDELPELKKTSIERFNRILERAEDIRYRIDRDDIPTRDQFNEHVGTFNEHVGTFNSHVNNRNNPHGVTIGQIPTLQNELNRLSGGMNSNAEIIRGLDDAIIRLEDRIHTNLTNIARLRDDVNNLVAIISQS